MDFDKYQKESRKTAVYPNKGNDIYYPTLGLIGEAGEISNEVSKVIRDDEQELNERRIKRIKAEMGDALWYFAQLATELDLNLSEIAEENLKKLKGRKKRGTIKGDGHSR